MILLILYHSFYVQIDYLPIKAEWPAEPTMERHFSALVVPWHGYDSPPLDVTLTE